MEKHSSLPPKEDATIVIYIEGSPTPHPARKQVCVCRSGWMEAQLRSKDEQNQWVVLKGLHMVVADALIDYFRLNSKAIRGLHADDRRMLTDIFELHELKKEMEAKAPRVATTHMEAKAAGEDTAPNSYQEEHAAT